MKTFFFFYFFGDRLKNFCEDLFFFFFWRALALVSLVLGLGLERSCPWPRECLSSERLSLALALASDFFCVLGLGLGLEPCVLDSTSDSYVVEHEYLRRIQYQSNLSLHSLCDAEVCYECVGLIPASLRPGNTAPFEKMSRRWRAVGNTSSDLTGSKFEPQTSPRSRENALPLD